MKRFIVSLFFFVFAIGVGAATPPSAAATIEIDNARAEAQANTAKTSVVFLTMVNRGAETDRLLSVSTPVAANAQLHMTKKRGEKMRMRRTMTISVPPGRSVELNLKTIHIMLGDLKTPLRQGSAFSLTLNFEKAGPVTVDVDVKPAGRM